MTELGQTFAGALHRFLPPGAPREMERARAAALGGVLGGEMGLGWAVGPWAASWEAVSSGKGFWF